MATTSDADLREFIAFASEHLNETGTELTPEEVLDLWRSRHPLPDELSESLAAIERALAQADRGEGLLLDEFDRRFRARHKIAADE